MNTPYLSHYTLVSFIFLAVTIYAGCSPENSNLSENDFSYLPIASDGGVIPETVVYPEATPVSNVDNSTSGPDTRIETDAGQDGGCTAISSTAKRIEIQVPVERPVEVKTPVPLAIYIMLDQSLTMNDAPIPYVTTSKWQTAVDAINAFVNDPSSADNDIAIGYFPLDILGATTVDVCDPTPYATPNVPMGKLPGNASAIVDSLSVHGPAGVGTPISPALGGAVNFCAQHKTTSGENCVVVFITDGNPNQCDLDFNSIACAAKNAYQKPPKIVTFAIGMAGADFNLLDAIAKAGGAPKCDPPNAAAPSLYYSCNVGTDAGNITLLQALELVRDYSVTFTTTTVMEPGIEVQRLECEWNIPDPPKDETFDKDKVNVEFSTAGTFKDTQNFVHVDSQALCKGSNAAWYYDNKDKPTRIKACPNTCSVIKATDLGKINIVLGCQTRVVF
jgi:hypothetical protein